MAKDKETYDSYPKDMFDNPPAGPVGVHRGAKSVGARAMPFVAVLLVAALAGVGAWGVFSGSFADMLGMGASQSRSEASGASSGKTSDTTSSGSDSKSTDKTTSAGESSSSSSSSDGTASQGTSSDGTTTDGSSNTQSGTDSGQTQSSDANGSTDQNAGDTQAAAAEANKATTVRVVNGTKISGHAASKAYVLKQAGYTNVVATNPSGSLPSASVVWYQNETDLATAKDVAATLGISSVRQVSGIAAPVVVVLMQ